MRLRNVKGAREELAESVYVIETPQEHKGGWNKVFGNDHPIRIEIGMGKGIFLLTLAKQNPDINYVGIEMYASVLVRAVQKLEEKAGECENTVETPDRTETDPAEECRPAAETMMIPNLRLLNMSAEYLDQVFAPGEVERIYLNFSDPWPKARHAKRRLTHRRFWHVIDPIWRRRGFWNSRPTTGRCLIFRWNRCRRAAGGFSPIPSIFIMIRSFAQEML